ncbi:hypothetical protein BTHI11S_03291 [Bosea thiooxidans]
MCANRAFSASSAPAGIGLLLYASINQFAWSQAIVILIAILGIVIISEALSAYVRSRIV